MRYRFADCELDTGRHTLTRGGAAVAVEPKVFDLLHLLLRHAGELVTRDTMVEEVWAGRIVSESAISACIAAARKAVGDDGKRQAVIRTVARRGLMLVAEVSGPAAVPTAAALPAGVQGGIFRLRYARSATGQPLAFAVSGEGPPVVYSGYGQTDVELDWHMRAFRPLFDAVGARHRLVRFDPVGTGRSGLEMDGVDLDTRVEDLRAVADAAGIERFALFSQSGGCLQAVRFAARYPERVTRLLINGGYAEGRTRRADGADGGAETMRRLIAEGWLKPESSFALAFSLLYFPEGPLDMAQEMVELMRQACPTDNMLRIRDFVNGASILEDLPGVSCPTLIVQSRADSVHPLAEAQKLAAGIRGAELAVLETANHVPLPGSPVWEDYLETVLGFLAG
jgi:DNA-binding winged helix-turn-helix (wHTH) protein/pimeloyl-ACP methyl ester carboxylesterase